MARTVSVEQIGPEGNVRDLDGGIAEGLEALRQRVEQALRFRVRTWFLNRSQGLDYDMLIGHNLRAETIALAITDVVRREAGDEIPDLAEPEFSLDGRTRVFRYSLTTPTIYGPMTIEQEIG